MESDILSFVRRNCAEEFKTVDARGLFCPEPVMLVRNSLRKAIPGSKLILLATDPSTKRDIPKLCRFLGYKLIEEKTRGNEFIYVIGTVISNPH